MRIRIFLPLLFAAFLGALAGCGRRMGDVSGVVTYRDKALPSGSIQFLGADGVPYPATIQADGTYSVKVPAGEAKVVVSCVDENQARAIGEKLKAGKGDQGRVKGSEVFLQVNPSLIPEKYSNWDNSGLKVVIVGGRNTHNFPLID